ncbi:hypothetical protein QBC40DRAFT_291358 [Triangularia verruculosa]|uniref:DUF7704 domain-containing protein n=1 Tax=Triangularia verruculosa TaxID=2587418 RepID=A0AAN6X651_9PEZI|nr:hypothetical protein QBC40DRAFT_291358 [Triangularia verruculosa]
MTSQLPAFPRFVFTIAEPISLISGTIGAVVLPRYFITAQTPTPILSFPEQSLLVAQQLGNMYFLAFLLGLFVLHSTTEIKVVRSYLWALWLADIGHMAVTCRVLGWEESVNILRWNEMTWGNLGATGFLFAVRSLYFLGAFGRDGEDEEDKRGRKKTRAKKEL